MMERNGRYSYFGGQYAPETLMNTLLEFEHEYVRYKADPNFIMELNTYLSEYAGHSNFADTDYYLHLIPSFYPELEKRMAPVNKDILPEVPYGR